MSHTTTDSLAGPTPAGVDVRTDRDDVLERLLRCTLSLCRAQRDPLSRDRLVEEAIESLDQVIRDLRDQQDLAG